MYTLDDFGKLFFLISGKRLPGCWDFHACALFRIDKPNTTPIGKKKL